MSVDGYNWTWQYLYGGRGEITIFRNQCPTPLPPNTHIFMWSVCIPGAGTSVSRFCSSSLRFNWISSHRSQACHCGQALLTIATGPALRRGFRAKLITGLPFWRITAMLSAATCHRLLREGALLCLHLWGEPVLSPPCSRSPMWEDRAHCCFCGVRVPPPCLVKGTKGHTQTRHVLSEGTPGITCARRFLSCFSHRIYPRIRF